MPRLPKEEKEEKKVKTTRKTSEKKSAKDEEKAVNKRKKETKDKVVAEKVKSLANNKEDTEKKVKKETKKATKETKKTVKEPQKQEKEIKSKRQVKSKDPMLEKLEYIGLNLEKPPKFLKEFEPLNYKVSKNTDETTYKVYKYVPIKDIKIMITPIERMGDNLEKYKYASPIGAYMKPGAKPEAEDIERYARFLKMINDTKIEDIYRVENEQAIMEKDIPFNIKYKNNFMWQIHYSDTTNQYFMLASSKEQDNSCMFYLLKRQIETHKSKSKKNIPMCFVPIVSADYCGKILKKAEIADLENYIWYFTKSWPQIYEVYDRDENMTLQIIGKVNIYEKIESEYRIIFKDKKEANNLYKLLKALFILSTELPDYYKYQCRINENGGIDFYDGEQLITYESLSKYIKEQYLRKADDFERIKNDIKVVEEEIEYSDEVAEAKTQEYLSKEKQIVTFLECKKSFFGKIKYFFKSKNVKSASAKIQIQRLKKDKKAFEREQAEENEIQIEDKKTYTIEDLMYISKEWEKYMAKYKEVKMDLKAILLKIKNLDLKIKNATIYIDEIEEHKKSIFEFWKFSNKDEIPSLTEAEENEEQTGEKIKSYFDYANDIEDLGKQVDELQRRKLSNEETDAIFAIRSLITNNLREKETVQILEEMQKEYEDNIDEISSKDFDIFGNLIEDKTKIKVLNTSKHREIEKNKFKVLNVNEDTALQDFEELIIKQNRLLKEAYNKISSPYDFSVYEAKTDNIKESGLQSFCINPNKAIKLLENEEEINLYRINIKEKMNVLFTSNIIFYDNSNKTLPLGLDVAQEVLFDLDKYRLNLVKKQNLNIVAYENEYCAKVKKINIFEYEVKEAK